MIGLTALWRTGLKAVVRTAVIAAGGQENCANVSTRIRRAAAFSDYANPALEDRHMPIDVAVELDAFNGDARIVSAMAGLLGHVVVKAPETAVATCSTAALLELIQANAQAVATIAAAKADGTLTRAEKAACADKLMDEIRACYALRARMLDDGGDA